MKAKISSITDLRDHALATIERLANGEIDVNEAAATGKLCDNVISTCKTQMEYSKMVNEEPNIPFLGIDQPKIQTKVIEANTSKGIAYSQLK